MGMSAPVGAVVDTAALPVGAVVAVPTLAPSSLDPQPDATITANPNRNVVPHLVINPPPSGTLAHSNETQVQAALLLAPDHRADVDGERSDDVGGWAVLAGGVPFLDQA